MLLCCIVIIVCLFSQRFTGNQITKIYQMRKDQGGLSDTEVREGREGGEGEKEGGREREQGNKGGREGGREGKGGVMFEVRM